MAEEAIKSAVTNMSGGTKGLPDLNCSIAFVIYYMGMFIFPLLLVLPCLIRSTPFKILRHSPL